MLTRRDCLKAAVSLGLLRMTSPRLAAAAVSPVPERLLVLLELKGGNDGLNTVIPYADARYFSARPRIAIAREQILQLDERTGLHPSLEALLALWRQNELAIVHGVGYPEPNLSHFRSIEIWDTASGSTEYLPEGWITRALRAAPLPDDAVADGLIFGSNDLGPLAGGARAVVLGPGPLLASPATPIPGTGSALAHLLKVQRDLNRTAAGLNIAPVALETTFPPHAFGRTVQTAVEALAKNGHIGVLRLTLDGFDTHVNQQPTQARLLQALAEGLIALRAGLVELKRWDETLVMTYAEFGRRVSENESMGTDHGTANVHFVTGGGVRGGLFGSPPDLGNLDAGNLRYGIDFRALYATAANWCWGDSARQAIGKADLLPLV